MKSYPSAIGESDTTRVDTAASATAIKNPNTRQLVNPFDGNDRENMSFFFSRPIRSVDLRGLLVPRDDEARKINPLKSSWADFFVGSSFVEKF